MYAPLPGPWARRVHAVKWTAAEALALGLGAAWIGGYGWVFIAGVAGLSAGLWLGAWAVDGRVAHDADREELARWYAGYMHRRLVLATYTDTYTDEDEEAS